MITIHHNFDEKKFKWLWAKYVKAGNIEKHCTACMIGSYSKKFSGTCNQNLSEQTTLVMDEVQEGSYEAIYFCGVVKKGYLHKNPLKNNYQHNVHFAIQPKIGAHDTFDFDGWHVEIEDGVLERIPSTYELKDKFFREPYNSHYYTCRIFRWMVGHFYTNELVDITSGFPDIIETDDLKCPIEKTELISDLLRWGKFYAKQFVDNETCYGFFADEQTKNASFNLGVVDRTKLSNYISENMGGGCGPLPLEVYSNYNHSKGISGEEMVHFIELGIEEYLDMLFPYYERRPIRFSGYKI